MNWDNAIPLLVLLTSFVAGLIIFCLKEEQQQPRIWLNMLAAIIKVMLVGIMLWGVFHEHIYETRFSMLPGIDLVLRADAFAMLFSVLSAVLWLVTTLYAIGYLKESPNRSRFFGFFSLCVTATMGIALAHNLFTFFIFYEMLTLVTYPLVVHRGNEKSLRAGRIYLAYTLSGGAVLLIAIVWLYSLAGPIEFVEGGALGHLGERHYPALKIIFFLLIGGFGVKAALVPLHGWLPTAMVAPAPVSALLHAVAVVKAGAFGIVRVVYDTFGIRFADRLEVTGPLAFFAAVTIIYGSLRALAQDDLKRRLAYSTVSQVSYIALGVAVAGPISTIGGVVHLLHQGIMKITLFFCAGIFAETIGISSISKMNGIARRVPWTMTAFTIGAFGMIGVPPMAGFISKWYLATGALETNRSWVIAILAGSSLLNAAYFLPIIYNAWFSEPAEHLMKNHPRNGLETGWMLLVPALVTAAFVIAAGVFAGFEFSPLEWAKLIAAREYR